MTGRHRLFLDANVLFSAAYRADSRTGRLWHVGPTVERVMSPYAIEEAWRNLRDPAARVRLDRLLTRVRIVPDVPAGDLPHGFTLPAKDRPILLSALAAEATHLLTGDRLHFGAYFGRSVHGMRIERPGEYLDREWPEDYGTR